MYIYTYIYTYIYIYVKGIQPPSHWQHFLALLRWIPSPEGSKWMFTLKKKITKWSPPNQPRSPAPPHRFMAATVSFHRVLYRFPPLLPEPCAQTVGDMLTCYRSGCESKQGCYMSEFHTPQKQLLL